MTQLTAAEAASPGKAGWYMNSEPFGKSTAVLFFRALLVRTAMEWLLLLLFWGPCFDCSFGSGEWCHALLQLGWALFLDEWLASWEIECVDGRSVLVETKT